MFSGGVFHDRFEKAEPSAIRAALGFAVSFGSIAGRVEGAITRYSWVLDNSAQTMAKWQATGATDTLLGVAMTVGYSL